MTPGQFQPCLQLCVLHRPEPRQCREARQVRGQQPAQAAEAEQELAGEIHGAVPPGAAAQENRHQFGVRKTAGASRQQLLAWPFSGGPVSDRQVIHGFGVRPGLPAKGPLRLSCGMESGHGAFMPTLTGKHVLLGVTGGIAAYKSPDLVRRLRAQGAEVRVVLTPSAARFVTPLTFQAVSGHPVRDGLWDASAEASMSHIELARWADLVLVAPATAGVLARLAAGMADDLLTTLCLATGAPVALAPAMNRLMWENAATRDNVATLQSHGLRVLGPGTGDQACGETGEGRMLEPGEIAAALADTAMPSAGPLAGHRLVITAGPTREALDPVRYLTNRSSGKMGYAVAAAAARMGAEVTLVSGPVELAPPPGVRLARVETAAQMRDAVQDALP